MELFGTKAKYALQQQIHFEANRYLVLLQRYFDSNRYIYLVQSDVFYNADTCSAHTTVVRDWSGVAAKEALKKGTILALIYKELYCHFDSSTMHPH